MNSSPAENPGPLPRICDRATLAALVDRYVDALPTHDPSGLPISRHVKYTENTAHLAVGDGLWVGASEAPTSFRIHALDPETGQAGFYGVMKEFDRPVIVQLRLKVDNGWISEIEHVVARILRPHNLENLVAPRTGLVEDLAPDERTPRAEMLRAADAYFDGLEQCRGDIVPLDDSCVRHENGGQATTNDTNRPWPIDMGSEEGNRAMAIIGTLTCRDQLSCGVMAFITSISPRRMLIVDEAKGLVFGFPMFNHRGDVRDIAIKGVPGVETIRMRGSTSTLQAGEIFKIRAGRIFEVEAMGHALPYGARTGWE